MTLLWMAVALAAATALAAYLKARETARRLERLSHSYWELRYEYGQLNAAVERLRPSEVEAPPGTAFVPLSSLKR